MRPLPRKADTRGNIDVCQVPESEVTGFCQTICRPVPWFSDCVSFGVDIRVLFNAFPTGVCTDGEAEKSEKIRARTHDALSAWAAR
jgi:hypothetical protein